LSVQSFIDSPLSGASPASAHDTDGVPADFGVNYEQQPASGRHGDQDQSILVRRRLVAQVAAGWVVKARGRLFERNAVLSQIPTGLLSIPLETHRIFVTQIFGESTSKARSYMRIMRPRLLD
jgi:hypothetical protein